MILLGSSTKKVRLIKADLDATRSEVRIGNYLHSSFSIENGLKQGDALSPLLFNFSLEYAIMKVQETRMEEGKSVFKILTGKPTGKRPVGMPSRR